jgi:hypothetical protein
LQRSAGGRGAEEAQLTAKVLCAFVALFVLSALAFACSANDSDTSPPVADDPSTGADDPDAGDAAPKATSKKKDAGAPPGADIQRFPSVESYGGKVIDAPKVVPILFSSDRFGPNIADFVPRLAASRYWQTITADYLVGPLTVAPPIYVNETVAPALSDKQIQAWLQNKFATDSRFGLPDSQTLYAVFYPAGVTITSLGGASCADNGGYHDETIARGVPIG